MIDKLAILVSNFVICWSLYQLLKYEKREADSQKQVEMKRKNIHMRAKKRD